jgi:hypothetical protein
MPTYMGWYLLFFCGSNLGAVEMDVPTLVNAPGRMFHRSDRLKSLYRGTSTHGRLLWSVGYFPIIHRPVDGKLGGATRGEAFGRLYRLREVVRKFLLYELNMETYSEKKCLVRSPLPPLRVKRRDRAYSPFKFIKWQTSRCRL